jgi:hypothetical protein
MNKECSCCGQKDRCQDAYAKLGQGKGPNVAWKSIWAFFVPVVVFIVAIAVTEPWLKARIENPKWLIVVQVLLGLASAAAILYIGKVFFRDSRPKECPPKTLNNKE